MALSSCAFLKCMQKCSGAGDIAAVRKMCGMTADRRLELRVIDDREQA